MKTAVFDVSLWGTREDAYRAMAEAFDFPGWFGGNLDALYDILTENEYAVTLFNTARAPKKLSIGPLIKVLRDAGALKAEYPGPMGAGDVAPDFICLGRENLFLGANVTIGPRVTVIAHEKVTIGDGAVIGAGTVITTDPVEKNASPRPVVIGRDAVIGVLCAVLPGACVRDGEEIPPRSVVS